MALTAEQLKALSHDQLTGSFYIIKKKTLLPIFNKLHFLSNKSNILCAITGASFIGFIISSSIHLWRTNSFKKAINERDREPKKISMTV